MLLDASSLIRFAHRGAAGPGPWTRLRKCSPQVKQGRLRPAHRLYCNQHISVLEVYTMRTCWRRAQGCTIVRGLPRQLRHGRFRKVLLHLLPTPTRDEGDQKVLFDFARPNL